MAGFPGMRHHFWPAFRGRAITFGRFSINARSLSAPSGGTVGGRSGVKRAPYPAAGEALHVMLDTC
ncbi:hypothetical protein ARTHRO8AJ_100003 [Arthrobacter sp. 8AJ]|nr:hypothetical protein ARTHRO8AJ_100003 [Arthrobacter sp. 8AJ]